MLSFRTFHWVQSLKMISVKRFKRLLVGYFISAALLVLLYMIFSKNEGVQQATKESKKRNADDIPYIVELKESNLSLDDEELLKSVNEKLRAITVENEKPYEADNNDHQSSDKAPREMIDPLEYGMSTGDSLNIKNMSTVTPDYFMRSVAYTETDGAIQVTDNPNNNTEVQYYALDKDGAMYDIMDEDDDGQFNEIPHILHQTWDTVDVPSQVTNWVRSWIVNNPYWVHWFWTERGFLDMMLRHFPEYYDIYRKYEHKVNKADMRKYFLLYKEGGVVADLDLECVRPFDDAIMDTECILVQEPIVHKELLYAEREFEYITPAFMACKPGHRFFKFVIDNLRIYAEKSHAMSWNDQVLNSTGTMFLSQVYHDYKKVYGGHDVYVAPAELFMPAFDSSFETKLRVKCNGYRIDNTLSETQKNLCEGLSLSDFQNYRTSNAYTWHHWSNSWAKDFVYANTQRINSITPGITIFDRQ